MKKEKNNKLQWLEPVQFLRTPKTSFHFFNIKPSPPATSLDSLQWIKKLLRIFGP